MCGIVGIINKNAFNYENKLKQAISLLKERGPDYSNYFINKDIGFGHTRLSIIDTSEAGNQPFIDETKNFILIFNGEFYNHQQFRKELENDGIKFISHSDTEILLYLLIKYKEKAIEKINGDFAFAFYDIKNNICIIARDRYGIKPLYYYYYENNFIFASELKAILQFDIPKILNNTALRTYFQLNYIPNNQCFIKNIKKLTPGKYLKIKFDEKRFGNLNEIPYYELNCTNNYQNINYKSSYEKLKILLDNAVSQRLISDVPIGCFLSGGIDSSIITALASQHTEHLNTFSIGFKDNNFFDETNLAEIVAKKFNTNHTTFKVSNDDLLQNINEILDYFSEPFADSSSIAVYVLSKLTRQKATVALSGDGADEIFAGYNKHAALYRYFNSGSKEKIVANLNLLWKILPKSRNTKITNTIRQLYKFSNAAKLSNQEKYWFLASIGNENYSNLLLKPDISNEEFEIVKNNYLPTDFSDFNKILFSDMNLVLAGDMLVKTDLMSMSNSLEVRVPFLDHNVVDFAFSLPSEYKITQNCRKKILRESFADILPAEILNHPKHGFEVPLTNWLRNELNYLIITNLNETFIKDQNIFNYQIIKKLIEKLNSKNSEDSASKIWALICFQNWWKKYEINN